jgi:hypothetical protein
VINHDRYGNLVDSMSFDLGAIAGILITGNKKTTLSFNCRGFNHAQLLDSFSLITWWQGYDPV